MNNDEAIRSERYRTQNFVILVIAALLLAVVDIFSIFMFRFTLSEAIMLLITSVVIYAVLALFLVSSAVGGRKSIAKSSRKPVFRIDYVGSTQTRTYHLPSCRLARLIKPKYKLTDSNLEFFKKRKFKACKVCMKGLKKI